MEDELREKIIDLLYGKLDRPQQAKGLADSILALLAPELADAERYRDALIHIEEYWNRDCNDTAMKDALYEIVETAQTALEGEGEKR